MYSLSTRVASRYLGQAGVQDTNALVENIADFAARELGKAGFKVPFDITDRTIPYMKDIVDGSGDRWGGGPKEEVVQRVASRYLDNRPQWLDGTAETASPLDLDLETALNRLLELVDYTLQVEGLADRRLDNAIRAERDTDTLKQVATRAHTALLWALRDAEASPEGPKPSWEDLTHRALSGLEAWGAHE